MHVVIPGYRVDQPMSHETVSKTTSPRLQLQSSRDAAVIPVGEGSPLKGDKANSRSSSVSWNPVVSQESCPSCVCALGCHTHYISSSGSQCEKLYTLLFDNVYI